MTLSYGSTGSSTSEETTSTQMSMDYSMSIGFEYDIEVESGSMTETVAPSFAASLEKDVTNTYGYCINHEITINCSGYFTGRSDGL